MEVKYRQPWRAVVFCGLSKGARDVMVASALAVLAVLAGCGGGSSGSSSATGGSSGDGAPTGAPHQPPAPAASGFVLSVTHAGNGSVTSTPAGIDCGSDCSESYAAGTQVTLSASPQTGAVFAGWSGACSGAGSCTVSMDAARLVTATFGSVPPVVPPQTGDDLCDGLVQDKLAHPMGTLAKPAKGQPYTDPQFGTRVVRITDVQADFAAKVAKPVYSTMPAWNADESYLVLYVTQGSNTGHHLFDGRTYQHVRRLDIQPTDLEHVMWSSSDPDVLFYTYSWEMSGNSLRQLIRYHVSTGQKEVVYNVPDAAQPGAFKVDMGGDPTYTSWDNDLFGLRRMSTSGNTGFTYRLSNDTESARVPGDAPQIAPSGTRYLLGEDVMSSVTHTRLFARHGRAVEHGDFTMLANGQDVWASVQFDVAPNGTLIVQNLHTGAVTEVIGQNTGYPYPPSGAHFSGHAFQKPGWMAVSVIGNPNGQTLLSQELLLADLNTGTVCRVAHHRSARNGPLGYWAEPHVNISPSGTRLLFASDWNGGDTVDAYVVELR